MATTTRLQKCVRGSVGFPAFQAEIRSLPFHIGAVAPGAKVLDG